MKLQVIIGSTRPGRVSDRIGKWVAAEAKALPDTTVEIVDLADYDMPLFNEPISPQYNPSRQPDEPVKRWITKLAEADAFVLVTPEYNRGCPAVLKNALDYIDFQFKQKPVAFVAHGTTGGAQAVAGLRIVIPGLLAVTVPNATFLTGRASDMIDESGMLSDAVKANPYGPEAALKTTLENTKWYADALATARAIDT